MFRVQKYDILKYKTNKITQKDSIFIILFAF
jgi:hypothetical protein